jgi:hypothetical protein
MNECGNPPLGSRGVGGELHSLAREGVGGANSVDCIDTLVFVKVISIQYMQ